MSINRCVLVAGYVGLAAASAFAQSTDEVRAVVAEMLADAQSRSSLLAGGTSGHDAGFFLASDDGAFYLNVNGFLQFRYVADFRDKDKHGRLQPGDDFDSGFQMRRMKIGFAGKVYKDWSYTVLGNFGLDGTFVLQDGVHRVRDQRQVVAPHRAVEAPRCSARSSSPTSTSSRRSARSSTPRSRRTGRRWSSSRTRRTRSTSASPSRTASTPTTRTSPPGRTRRSSSQARRTGRRRRGSSISSRARPSSSATSRPRRTRPSGRSWGRRSTISRAPTREPPATLTATPSSTPWTCR